MSGERRPVEPTNGHILPPAYKAIYRELLPSIKPHLDELEEIQLADTITPDQEKKIPILLLAIAKPLYRKIDDKIQKLDLSIDSDKAKIRRFTAKFGHAPPYVGEGMRRTPGKPIPDANQRKRKIIAGCVTNNLAQMHIFLHKGHEIHMVRFEGVIDGHVAPVITIRGKRYVLDNFFIEENSIPTVDEYVKLIVRARKGFQFTYNPLSVATLPTKSHGEKYLLKRFENPKGIRSAIAQTYFNWAYSNNRPGSKEYSADNYVRALEHEPEFLEAHINLARVYTDQKKFKDAIFHLTEVIKLEPSAENYNRFGLFYEDRNNRPLATSMYRKALAVSPNNWLARKRLDFFGLLEYGKFRTKRIKPIP
jgi:tetratricopeptide (TPR) repeat protein